MANAGPSNNAWGAPRPQCITVSRQEITKICDLGCRSNGIVDKAFVPLFGVCAVKYLLGRCGIFVMSCEIQNARELVAAQELAHHPNILDFYGKVEDTESGRNREVGYFTEYMEGGDLLKVMGIRKNEDFPSYFKMATRWSIQVARAIAFCHSQNVIHRNIKPENMLLSRDHMTIKIFDFGFSRPDSSGHKESNVGSLYYVAPEVLGEKGQQVRYGISIDVYSYGIFLYAVFNRRHPGQEMNKLLDISYFKRELMEGKRPECVIQLPDEIDVVMRRCWETNPDNRPSMEEVVVYLENYWEKLYPKELI